MNTASTCVKAVNILIVEDDDIYRALCKRYLSKNQNVTCIIVDTATAVDAMKLCSGQHYDCLILDYDLPDATGTQLITRLREALSGRMPPAIILTAEGGVDAATEAVRTNAADFLSK